MDRIEMQDLAHASDPLVICTFGRSGTHLLIDIVRRQFSAFAAWKMPGQSGSELYLPLEEFAGGQITAARARKMLARARRLIVRSHAWFAMKAELERGHPDFARWLEARAKVLFVVRDPVVAIAKLWTLASQHRQQHGIGPIEDMDAFVLEQALRWSTLVRSALDAPRTEIIRLEGLLADPRAEIARIALFLHETPRYAQPLLIRPHRHRLDTICARLHPRPRSTHVLIRARCKTRYRLDWTPERLAMLDAHAGETMERLGYQRPLTAPAPRSEREARLKIAA